MVWERTSAIGQTRVGVYIAARFDDVDFDPNPKRSIGIKIGSYVNTLDVRLLEKQSEEKIDFFF